MRRRQTEKKKKRNADGRSEGRREDVVLIVREGEGEGRGKGRGGGRRNTRVPVGEKTQEKGSITRRIERRDDV